MNKHVNKLSREASDARKMIDDSESDSDDSGNDLSHNVEKILKGSLDLIPSRSPSVKFRLWVVKFA